MSIPLNQSGSGISSLPMVAHFLPPDDLENTLLLDRENGGIALNDTSEGLNYQEWILRYAPSTGDITIDAANTTPSVVFNLPDITEISLAFDQNMNPFVAYVAAGVAKYYWWDPSPNDYVHVALPANSRCPRCCMDDKGDNAAGYGWSDIILCYVTDDVLYERHQRDRFTDPRTLQNPFLHPDYELPAVLIRVGMNKGNRLQWKCDLLNPLDWCRYVNDGN